MKRSFVLGGIVFAAFIFINANSLNELDMNGSEESAERFQFKYTGTVNLGAEVMPLVGQLSKDGLKMYFTSQNFKGEKQLYVMQRDEVNGTFQKPVRLRGSINNSDYDIIMPTVSADENTMIFVNSVDGTQKGNDLYITVRDESLNNDLFIANRVGEDGPFVNVRPLDEINDPNLSDSYPWISYDGLRLYFTKQKGSDIKFYSSSRDDIYGRFSKPKSMGIEIPKISNNMSCFLSADELEVFVLSGDKIYHANREYIGGEFDTPVEIVESNSNGYMSGITMTENFGELFVFNSVGFRNTQVMRFVNTEAGKNDKPKVTASDR